MLTTLNQWISDRFGLPPGWKLGRVAQLLLLMVTLLTQDTLGMLTANSLFLSTVGSDSLPLFFICLGLFGAVVFTVVSQQIDRFSRTRLFEYLLGASIVLLVALRLLLGLNSPLIYYCLSITAFFQFDLHVNVLYPNLLTDYFTTLEYKRYAPFIGIAQAIGILLAGGLANLLLRWFRTADLLWWIAGIFAISIAQIIYLETTQRRLDAASPKKAAGTWEYLKMFPDLVKRYPLIFFLASSSVLFILIYVISEFLWFTVYAQNFTDDKLTGFLGLARVITSTTQLVMLYCFTRPLLRWLGVSRMNLVFPISTLAALLNLAFNFNLVSAIGININGDSLDKGVNKPVHQLNYNAIPPEISGRVRALTDGVFYALGLTLAGILLWISHLFLTLPQITWLGIGLAAVLFILKVPMGKFYAQGLEDMIRSNSLNLDEFSSQLPSQSSSLIQEFLTKGDRYAQIKGLELAGNLGRPSQFFPEIQALLPQADADVREAILKLLTTNTDQEVIQYCEQLIYAENLATRTLALQVLIVNQYDFSEQQLSQLLEDSDREVRGLAAIAAQILALETPQIVTICEQVWHNDLHTTAAELVVQAGACSGNSDFVPFLKRLVHQQSPTVKREGLEALAILARRGDQELAEVAVMELNHVDPGVRLAAFQLLDVTSCKGMLRYIGNGLGDPDPQVREKAAIVLASYGQQGLSLAQDSLASSNPDVVKTAIAAIGQVRTKQAGNILFEYIAPELQQLSDTRRWQGQIPQGHPNWKPLAIAIANYHQQMIQKVLYILSCLGYSRTVNLVNRALNATNPREVANAIEVLASLPHRRFVLPLLPILEQLSHPTPPNRIRPTPQWLRTKGYQVLLEALEARDRWIRIGALIPLAIVPSALVKDPDPVVRQIAELIFPPVARRPVLENTLMNRLLLLKNIALFKNLSLDELFLIDQVLEQEQFLAGQTIFEEGSWGKHLYIIAEGGVRTVKNIDDEQYDIKYLSVGEYFGEVALFDDAPNWEGAIAMQDCTLLKLEKNRFISLITQRPQIILEICRFLSQRLRETDRFRSTSKLLPPSEETTETPKLEEKASLS